MAFETNDGGSNNEGPPKIDYIITNQNAKASKAPKASKASRNKSPRGPKSERSNLEGRQNKMRNKSLRERNIMKKKAAEKIRFDIQQTSVWARKTRKQRK